MKKLIGLCVIIVLPAMFALIASQDSTLPAAEARKVVPQQHCDITCFEWMTGLWRGEQNGKIIEEHWGYDEQQRFSGKGMVIKGSDTISIELMRIKGTDTVVDFVALVAHNKGEVRFRLISSDSNRFVFENPEHDYPTRVIYQFVPPGTMRARIEGMFDSTLKGVDFIYNRVWK